MLEYKIIYITLITVSTEGMSHLKENLWPLLYQIPHRLTINLVSLVRINTVNSYSDPGVN